MKLYDHPLSGNGYKARLLLSHLGRVYDYVPVDILAGESRTPSRSGRCDLIRTAGYRE